MDPQSTERLPTQVRKAIYSTYTNWQRVLLTYNLLQRMSLLNVKYCGMMESHCSDFSMDYYCPLLEIWYQVIFTFYFLVYLHVMCNACKTLFFLYFLKRYRTCRYLVDLKQTLPLTSFFPGWSGLYQLISPFSNIKNESRIITPEVWGAVCWQRAESV